MQPNLNLEAGDRRPLQVCLTEWTYADRSLVFRLGLAPRSLPCSPSQARASRNSSSIARYRTALRA